jgi:hypothetical protein
LSLAGLPATVRGSSRLADDGETGSLDLIGRARGIAGNDPLGDPVHHQIKVLDNNRTNQGRLTSWFNDRREGAVAYQEFELNTFGRSALDLAAVGVPNLDRSAQGQAQPFHNG